MLVGRTAELARLDELLDGAAEGHGGRLLVVGEPGIGKTELLRTLALRAARRGLAVVSVRAAEGAEELPFALLDDLHRGARGEVPAGVAGRARRSELLLALLADRARGGPLLVTVDDAHNADSASLAALALATGRAGQLPIAVVVASRPDARVERSLSACARLDLAGLSADAGAALLRSVLPARHVDGTGLSAGADPLRRLAVALRGHPLAILESSRLLTRDQIAGDAPLPDPMPVAPALRHAWGLALDRLPDRTQEALLALAVAGPERHLLGALLAAAGSDADAFDPAVQGRLVAPDPATGLRFAHPLVRDVVLDRAPPAAVRDLHRRAAVAARDLGLPPAVIVGHLVHAADWSDRGAGDEIEAEARRAEQLGHLDAACRAWEAAARLAVRPDDRERRALEGIRLVVEYGLGASAIGTLRDLVGEHGPDAESEGWLRWLRLIPRWDRDPAGSLRQQWAEIEAAERTTPGVLPILLWEAASMAFTSREPEQALRAAVALAGLERQGALSPALPPWAGTAVLAAAAFEAADVAASMALRTKAIDAAAGLDPTAVDLGLLLDAIYLDDLLLDSSAAALHRLVVAESRLSTAAEPLACICGIQAWRARARGDWGSAFALVAQARPIADAVGATGAQRGVSALAAELAGLCADEEAFRVEVEAARAIALRWGDRRRLATVDRALGLRALVEGRYDVAAGHLRAAADAPGLGRGLRDGVVPAMVDLVEAHARSGQAAEAARRARVVLPILTAMGLPLARALAARVGALAGIDADQPGAGSAADFAAALDLHEQANNVAADDPFERARTLLLAGEHLRRGRKRAAARPYLAEAVRILDGLGAKPWLHRARQELAACGGGAGPATAEASGADLTPQERAVAQVAARGGSTREIAAELYLSPRTVEYHLGHVYRKLGISSRSALAALLAGSIGGQPMSTGTRADLPR